MEKNENTDFHIKNIKAPELNFDTDESDTEFDSPPIIFHPSLKQGTLDANLNGDLSDSILTKDSGVELQLDHGEVSTDEKCVTISSEETSAINSDIIHTEKLLPTTISELSLDDALESFPISTNAQLSSNFSSCNSSGNSNDLMAQLNNISSQLQDEKKRDNELLNQFVSSCAMKDIGISTEQNNSTSTKHMGVSTEKDETADVSVNFQPAGSFSVIQRYGRNATTETDDGESTIDDIRRKIKEDSFQICKNKGVLNDKKSTITSTTTQIDKSNVLCSDRLVQHTDDKLSFLQLSSKKGGDFKSELQKKPKVESTVDVMLDCVNKMINATTSNHFSNSNSEDDSSLDREENFVDNLMDGTKSNDTLNNVDNLSVVVKEESFVGNTIDKVESCRLSNSGDHSSLHREENCFYDDTEDIISEEEPEYVQHYKIFTSDTELSQTSEDNYIKPNSNVSSLEDHKMDSDFDNDFEDDLKVSERSSILHDIKVIAWNSILEEELYPHDDNDSPTKTMQKTNIFDNVFLNSFIVDDKADKKDSLNVVDTTPKKDILGVRNKENKVKTSQSGYSESCNRKYVAGLYLDKVKIDQTKSDKIGVDDNALLKEVKEFKNEIDSCINGEKSTPSSSIDALTKLTRQLNFSNEYANKNGNSTYALLHSKKVCLACTFPSSSMETPLKHIDICPKYLDNLNHKDPSGVSTQDILSLINQDTQKIVEDNEVKPKSKNKKKKKKNKKNGNSVDESQTTSVNDSSAVVENKPVGLKKEDDKLNSGSFKNANIEDVEKSNAIKDFLESVKNDGGAILVDEKSSFSEEIKSIPDTEGELLLLKVPLEAPGVCKANSNESKLPYADCRNSDSFIELVTLFILLLKGNKNGHSDTTNNIPFDVVAMQQCLFDDELFLLVGVVENSNSQNHKFKRTKLGSTFFHAVSSFFNSVTLSDVMKKLWDTSKSNQHPIDIFEQIELNDRLLLLSKKKLSSFINVLPDNSIAQKIFNIQPSIRPYVYKKNGSSNLSYESCNWFETSLKIPEYTCIYIENILLMNQKNIIDFFMRLRFESVELCGLRIGYPANSGEDNRPVLAVAICEVNAANVEEGKILLSECTQLRNIPISFQSEDHFSVNDEPCIKYSLNKNRAYRNLVQWFGPHFASIEDFKNATNIHNTTSSTSNKNLKRKPNIDTNYEGLPLLVSAPSYGILLVSASLQSSLLALIISLAGKRGLSLKAFVRNVFSSSQLHAYGLSKKHIDSLTQHQGFVNSNVSLFFNVLLFFGCNAITRLVGLTEKLTSLISNPVTGETLNNWTKDEYIHIDQKSHNMVPFNGASKRKVLLHDYFAVLNFVDSTYELFKTQTTTFSSKHFVLTKYLNDCGISNLKPSLNLRLYVLHGNIVVKLIPDLFKKINGNYIFASLNQVQKMFWHKKNSYEVPLELIGLKYIKHPQKSEIQSLLAKNHERNETLMEDVEEKNLAILVFQGDNEKTLSFLDNTIRYHLSKYVQNASENIIAHIDQCYIMQLLFQFFHPYEICSTSKFSTYSHTPMVYVNEQNDILHSLEKLFNIDLLNKCTKKYIAKNEYVIKAIKSYDLQPTSYLYEVPIVDLAYPIRLLFSDTESYAGYSVSYKPEFAGVVIKILSRFRRFGFQICALNFPVSIEQDNLSQQSLCVGLKRIDALVVLEKLMIELETSYNGLSYKGSETVTEAKAFFQNVIKDKQGRGGLFYCNYWAAFEELQFVEDDSFQSRTSRSLNWNPPRDTIRFGYDDKTKQCTPIPPPILCSATAKAHEVSVVLITEPLITGKYLGKEIPFDSNFLEFWATMDKIGYRCIAFKMTSLTENQVEEVLGKFNLESKKRKQMEWLLSSVETPFIAGAFLGSCILSNLWLQLERYIENKDALDMLKKFTLVTTTSNQVSFILPTLFKTVYPNCKVEILTEMKTK